MKGVRLTYEIVRNAVLVFVAAIIGAAAISQIIRVNGSDFMAAILFTLPFFILTVGVLAWLYPAFLRH